MFERKDGRVYIDMPQEDYDRILFAIGYAASGIGPVKEWLGLANRLNEGNKDYRPYKVE